MFFKNPLRRVFLWVFEMYSKQNESLGLIQMKNTGDLFQQTV
jgi:hypothetical protein